MYTGACATEADREQVVIVCKIHMFTALALWMRDNDCRGYRYTSPVFIY